MADGLKNVTLMLTREFRSRELGLSDDDILIDEESFQTAANEFRELSQDIKNLRNEIQSMLDDLKTGFDTPAGRKFYSSCTGGVLTPLDQTEIVMNHIADNLMSAKQMYTSVFEEYRDVVAAFK